MNDTPRPLNLGEIFDRTLNFYRSRFLLFFGISAIPTGVVLVLASGVFLFFAWWGNNGAAGVSASVARAIAIVFVVLVCVLAVPLWLAASALASAALTFAVNRAWDGENVTIRAVYKAIWPRAGRYMWLYLLQALAVWGIPIAAFTGLVLLSVAAEALLGGSFANGGADSGSLAGLVMLLAGAGLFGFAVWMLLRLSLAFPASIVEQVSAWAALKRSVRLSNGTRGRIFLLYLLGVVLGYMLTGALVVVVAIVVMLIPGMASPQHQQTIGMILIFAYYGCAFAMQALTKPVYGIALLLFYYDQRIRLEGFDIEWMMQRAGLVAPTKTDTAAAAAEPAPERSPEISMPAGIASPGPAARGVEMEMPRSSRAETI